MSSCSWTPQQAIREHYREWLDATGRRRSNFNGVLFASQYLGLGPERLIEMSMYEICQVIGADVAMAEQSWMPPPLVCVTGEQAGNE